MGNKKFRNTIKPHLDAGKFAFVRIMPDGGNRLHDGTNLSNEIGHLRFNADEIIQKVYVDGDLQKTIKVDGVLQKVMLTSVKYHQRRKALTEMVSAWLDEALCGNRIVPNTYAETFTATDSYTTRWGAKPKDGGRVRVCQVVHEYYPGQPGDEWRGEVYLQTHDLEEADRRCRSIIESHPDAERMALLDFLTINQDRSARNWITDHGKRFYAIDNGMAWFHEYPDTDDWKIGCVIDDVLIQRGDWRFISGIFTTSYAGRRLSTTLAAQLIAFNWELFCQNLDLSCQWLGLSQLSLDWRFLGLRRRLEWIAKKGCFPTAGEYRGWLNNGSELMTPPEIVETGGKLVWRDVEDRP